MDVYINPNAMNPGNLLPDSMLYPVANAATSDSEGEFWDSPAFETTWRNRALEFYTCLICVRKNKPGCFIGCVHWGFKVDDGGSIDFWPTPAPTVAARPPYEEFQSAIGRWNRLMASFGVESKTSEVNAPVGCSCGNGP